MELVNINTQVSVEEVGTERAQISIEQLRDLELCLIAGGMGDVQQ